MSIRVHAFYKKPDNNLYAYCYEKKNRDRFLKERNPNCFTYSKLDIPREFYDEFERENYMFELHVVPLNVSLNSNNDIEVLMTMGEEDTLIDTSYKIDTQIMNLRKNVLGYYDLKKKYRECIEYFTNVTYYKKNEDGTKELISTSNLLYLFIKLFKDTFVEMKDEESYD